MKNRAFLSKIDSFGMIIPLNKMFSVLKQRKMYLEYIFLWFNAEILFYGIIIGFMTESLKLTKMGNSLVFE